MRFASIVAALFTIAACGDKANETADTAPPNYTTAGTTGGGVTTGVPSTGTPSTGTPTGTTTAGLEIAGTWTDQFYTEHTITDTVWTQGMGTTIWGTWHITWYDNNADALVAQNDSSNGYFPDLWSRFDWHFDGKNWWYCQTGYAVATEAEALKLQPADSSDLAYGCSGYPWSMLTP